MCISPITRQGYKTRKGQSQDSYTVPCGKCVKCVARRASGWSFRLQEEAKVSSSALMVTLTYDPQYMPTTDDNMMTLKKSHLQSFMKRLRYYHPTNDIKYYGVGEYGGKSSRPHYHIILFNVDLNIDLSELPSAGAILKGNVLDQAWTFGHVHVLPLTPATTSYTLKYISKGKKVPQFYGDKRQPEFSLMSKGLGQSYCSPRLKKWHNSDKNNRMYVQTQDGKKIAMPRYYKDRIYTPETRKEINEHLKKTHLDEIYDENMTEHEKRYKSIAESIRRFKSKQKDNSNDKI